MISIHYLSSHARVADCAYHAALSWLWPRLLRASSPFFTRGLASGPLARGMTGGASESFVPSESMCVIVRRSAETSKTLKAALPVASEAALLLGHSAPSVRSPSQYAVLGAPLWDLVRVGPRVAALKPGAGEDADRTLALVDALLAVVVAAHVPAGVVLLEQRLQLREHDQIRTVQAAGPHWVVTAQAPASSPPWMPSSWSRATHSAPLPSACWLSARSGGAGAPRGSRRCTRACSSRRPCRR